MKTYAAYIAQRIDYSYLSLVQGFRHRLFHRNTNIHIYIIIMDTWQNMFQNGNITQSGDYHWGSKAAVMIATGHNMVHGALRTIIIHKKNIETNGCSLTQSPVELCMNANDLGIYVDSDG